VEQCFGGIGSKCARIFGVPAGRRTKEGLQEFAVSVGSIAHDNCCRLHPNGFHCREGFTTEDCAAEWGQAKRDYGRRFFWRHEFGPYSAIEYTDDLGPVPGRRLVLRNAFDGCYDGLSVENAPETVSSRALAAPEGTRLDCGEQEFCASGRAHQPRSKDYIVCDP
jgi:hypothetical protein